MPTHYDGRGSKQILLDSWHFVYECRLKACHSRVIHWLPCFTCYVVCGGWVCGEIFASEHYVTVGWHVWRDAKMSVNLACKWLYTAKLGKILRNRSGPPTPARNARANALGVAYFGAFRKSGPPMAAVSPLLTNCERGSIFGIRISDSRHIAIGTRRVNAAKKWLTADPPSAWAHQSLTRWEVFTLLSKTRYFAFKLFSAGKIKQDFIEASNNL